MPNPFRPPHPPRPPRFRGPRRPRPPVLALLATLTALVALIACETQSTGAPAAPSIAVAVEIDGPGRVVTSPAGLDCVDGCVATFPEGSFVRFEARPAGGADFTGWEGDCRGTESCELRLAATATVRAAFAAPPSTPGPSETDPGPAPEARPRTVVTDEDTRVTITLLGSDPDGDPLAYAVATEPAHGTLTGLDPDAGTLTYTPEPDYHGVDAFTFTASDGTATSEPATVSVTVAPADEIFLTPASATVLAGETLELRVTASDPATDLDALVWSTDRGELEPLGGGVARFTAPLAKGSATVRVETAAGLGAGATIALPGGLADDFRIVAIPDTQNMVRYSSYAYQVDAMTSWVVDNVEPLDIAFATQAGDVVYYADRRTEWERADAALSRFDGVLPYSVAFGDHEYETEENMATSTALYREYYGAQRYAEYDWYGGASPGGQSDDPLAAPHGGLSHYQIFEAGGRRFLHLALEWEAPGPVTDPTTPLGWANSVLAAHPDLPTIVTTHAYLWDAPEREGRFPDGAREGIVVTGDGTTVYPGTSGEAMFRELVAPHPQVFMVLSGHYHLAEGNANGEYHQVSLNERGLPVYEMLANYQDYPRGGNGWLRLLHFEPGGGAGGLDRISVETYSPPLDAYQSDSNSRFSFDLDFAERFAGF